jgi:hypothetical protein
MTIKKSIIILGGLFTVSIFILVYLTTGIDHDGLAEIQTQIIFEATKALLQLSVLLLIGGAVTAVYKAIEINYNERKDKEKQKDKENKVKKEIRIEYLQRVGKAYRAAKATRRTLRAAGLSTKYTHPSSNFSKEQIEIYRNQMGTLNEAQLELEALKIKAESLPELNKLKNYINSLNQWKIISGE